MVSNEEIENFINISGCTDFEIAKRYLEMYPGDMNSAINEYFSNLGNESTSNRNTSHPGNNLFHDEEDVRTPIPSFNDQLIPDDHNILNSSQFLQNQRMVGTEDIIPPVDDFSSQMFSPPEIIMFSEPFEIAKEKAKSQKKLILVNIQSPNEFSSMILNRDIWNDSLIIEFIQEHFIFWQRSCSTPEGSEWLNLYNVAKLPHVSVIDPRTGRQLKVWDVAKSFSDSISASSEIIEFLESENTLRAFNRISTTSNTIAHEVGSSTVTNISEQSSDSFSTNTNINTVQTTPGIVPTQNQVQPQPNTQVEVPKINSELAMLHMERMRRRNSEKK
ncbi:UAS ubiquitin protein [Cryptosporidium ubiquitum]|uniref:UAS ubiquitin protein n=1 Tax=Cryptosporidium ubiquitum TaxID=857276 RepID=A0A1J4MJC9_9CRYT|nr:UAS ubiquitin protein [Cryptosporidium ubiquitum]OII74370.1 UAS ubiquitin protein [Cryptosporidium ubiquitum]